MTVRHLNWGILLKSESDERTAAENTADNFFIRRLSASEYSSYDSDSNRNSSQMPLL